MDTLFLKNLHTYFKHYFSQVIEYLKHFTKVCNLVSYNVSYSYICVKLLTVSNLRLFLILN